MESKLLEAISHRTNKRFDIAETLFLELLNHYSTNPRVYYHYAWLCDNMGRETEAAPKYERALQLGLEGNELKGCYLGLASTYRCIGEYRKSDELLQVAVSQFPENDEFKVFWAMTLYNLGNHGKAMELLLQIIAKTSNSPSIAPYANAIEFYSNKLDERFL